MSFVSLQKHTMPEQSTPKEVLTAALKKMDGEWKDKNKIIVIAVEEGSGPFRRFMLSWMHAGVPHGEVVTLMREAERKMIAWWHNMV